MRRGAKGPVDLGSARTEAERRQLDSLSVQKRRKKTAACGLCEEFSEEFSESSIRITGILQEWDVIHTKERSKRKKQLNFWKVGHIIIANIFL